MGVENFLDLAARAKEGIFIHPVMWLLVGWGGQLGSTAPWVYFGIAVVFALIAIGRLRFELTLARAAATDRAARAQFTTLMLLNPAVWSLAAVLSILRPDMADARFGMMFALVALAAAAGMALVIEPFVRRGYPILTLMPLSCALWLTGQRADAILGTMALLMMIYVLRASNVVYTDYWSAVDARADLERRAISLELLSNTDALTQLRNRPHFDRRLADEWARSRRSKEPLSLLLVDLDHFKKINDHHGHAVGDACLKAAAAAMQEALFRPNDLLARYGGEEFVALLPAIAAEGAVSVAERLRQAVADLVLLHEGQSVPITCSIGHHTVTDFEHDDIEQAMRSADQAMYEAKQRGRDRVVSTPASPRDPAVSRNSADRSGRPQTAGPSEFRLHPFAPTSPDGSATSR